jgi:hypothetical protein
MSKISFLNLLFIFLSAARCGIDPIQAGISGKRLPLSTRLNLALQRLVKACGAGALTSSIPLI